MSEKIKADLGGLLFYFVDFDTIIIKRLTMKIKKKVIKFLANSFDYENNKALEEFTLLNEVKKRLKI